MDLREYLFRNRIKTAAFARKIGFSAGHMHNLIYGRVNESKSALKKVKNATNGEVDRIYSMDGLPKHLLTKAKKAAKNNLSRLCPECLKKYNTNALQKKDKSAKLREQ